MECYLTEREEIQHYVQIYLQSAQLPMATYPWPLRKEHFVYSKVSSNVKGACACTLSLLAVAPEEVHKYSFDCFQYLT